MAPHNLTKEEFSGASFGLFWSKIEFPKDEVRGEKKNVTKIKLKIIILLKFFMLFFPWIH